MMLVVMKVGMLYLLWLLWRLLLTTAQEPIKFSPCTKIRMQVMQGMPVGLSQNTGIKAMDSRLYTVGFD